MVRKKQKFYAVRKGYSTGVYPTWEECKALVEGYANAEYKSFPTRESAEAYMRGDDGPVLRDRPAPTHDEEESADDNGLRKVVIYADGACTGNPGPGGYGAVIFYGDRQKEFSAGFRLTTNNRMEILGCIVGLSALKEACNVTIYSDSKYVVNTMTRSWAVRWRKQGWKRPDKNGGSRDVPNRDLWIQMLALCDKHRVRFEWVRGHAGNEGNERCDELARAAVLGKLEIDSVYENHGRAP